MSLQLRGRLQKAVWEDAAWVWARHIWQTLRVSRRLGQAVLQRELFRPEDEVSVSVVIHAVISMRSRDVIVNRSPISTHLSLAERAELVRGHAGVRWQNEQDEGRNERSAKEGLT